MIVCQNQMHRTENASASYSLTVAFAKNQFSKHR